MKKLLLFAILIPLAFLVSCSNGGFEVITPAEAKEMIDNNEDVIILDVREQSEFDKEHIPDAVLLSLGDIEDRADDVIPDKTKTYLVYCRSGNRSNEASKILVSLGYENVYDFGGIINWPYRTIK